MKGILKLFLIIPILSACQQSKKAAREDITYEAFEQTTIRAMAVQDDQTVWVGGPGGFYAFTQDGGDSWTQGKIEAASGLDFRSIALLDKKTVLLLTAGSPALIFKSVDQGAHWEQVFKDPDSLAFFDSMVFSDARRGMAFGDVKAGCFNVITTRDGGDSWQRLPCATLPVPREGEVAFASSNTCIATQGEHVWIGTGGQYARVLRSPDFGQTWETASTPIIQGNTMTGIYSIDFYNDKLGVIAGGDYENQSNKQENLALTTDGGVSWKRVDHTSLPGYISCIQFAHKDNGNTLYAAGYEGLYISRDQGQQWENLVKGDLTTLRESASGDYLWYAGRGILGKITIK